MDVPITIENLKKARRFLWTQDRPYRCRNKNHPKWRLTKKWFNRYRKQSYLGRIIGVNDDGNLFYTTDVRLRKTGRHGWAYKYTAKRLTN
jgi:hypothetical protein